MTEQINQGSLKYNLSTNDFSINPTGTVDRWVTLPISSSAEHVTKEDLKTWAETR